MKLKIMLESSNSEGFRAYVPSLPDCTAIGLREDDVLEDIRNTILLHFGIEEVVHPKNGSHMAYYRHRLTQALTGNMSTEKKQAALTALTGICLLVAVIWGAGFFA